MKGSNSSELGTWVGKQRSRYTNSKLSPDKIERLEALGFDWDPRETFWEEKFAELVQFKKKHGHCNIPEEWSENTALAKWRGKQRTFYKRGKLSPDRVARIEALGFDWDPHASQWEERFVELARFNEEHGHCAVPRKWSENSKLGIWVINQRHRGKHGMLDSEKIFRLEQIGFVWHSKDAAWEEMFAEMEDFKKAFGHCDVSIWSKEYSRLGKWVNRQRTSRKRGDLRQDRFKRLNGIGFVWDAFQARWEPMFDKLRAYAERIGDCQVPIKWEEDQQLGTWVSTQRARAKKGQMPYEQRRRLEEIGFRF